MLTNSNIQTTEDGTDYVIQSPINVNKKHIDYIKTNYKNYDISVQKYMLSVFNNILDRYEDVPPEWYIQLDQLAFIQHTMFLAQKDIMKNGNITEGPRGCDVVNPNIKIYHTGLDRCDKIIKQFGLNPRSSMYFQSNNPIDTSALLESLLD